MHRSNISNYMFKFNFFTFFYLLLILTFPTLAAEEAPVVGVVATSHPLATEAGLSILRAGGNAIDAAAAVQFALNVVEPQSSGMGGGAFILVYIAKTHQVYAVDAREVAPQLATPDQFMGHRFEENSSSGISVGVPGTVAGFNALLNQWGRMTLGQVLQPAMRLAQQGFAVTPYLAGALKDHRAKLLRESNSPFFNQDGTPLRVGQRLVQVELAHTFEILAKEGATSFYRGEIAHAIVAAQRSSRMGPAGWGRMSLTDLANYHVYIRKALAFDYQGYHLVGMPPPSSGASSLFEALGIVSPYTHDKTWQDRAYRDHLSLQALSMAFQDRENFFGDPEQMTLNPNAVLTPSFLDQRSKALLLGKLPNQLIPLPKPSGTNTTHFSIVDKEGNVVSCTSTVEQLWGSGLWVNQYGFLLNNELTDFDANPLLADGKPSPNQVKAGLRPRSSMSPILVFHQGRWILAYGSPGGPTIISTLLQVTQGLLDLHNTPQQVISEPRYAVMNGAGFTLIEQSFPVALENELKQLGHQLTVNPDAQGSVQAVGLDEEYHYYWGAADPRRDGSVGYQ
ncbi:gamma-glutamyltranspeptidase precursor [Ferrovum sp. JA12]|uniref:gamma-glutamyltransferase n=1 Tax=Ferrovum sp. JA12 TaxID=1356299 RepID=UPI0007038E42|nr:gamma-glutamyltransferase [Ferrovum sp. JA12]KRH78005.1 gamma-glutamyltranspeptidase precursor [Ferrovum sp. JA12]